MVDICQVNLNLVLALRALLRARSVSRAAAELHVTQSTMSHSLAELRRLFDDRLLVRDGGALVPTPVAESLVEPLERGLLELEQLFRARVHFDPTTSVQRFAIATSDLFSALVLPPVVGRLAREAPGVDLVIVPLGAGTADDLSQGRADVALAGRDDVAAQGLSRVELGSERLVCVARAAHPRLRARLTLELFCSTPHVLVGPGDEPGLLDRALAARGRTRRVAVRLPDYGALGELLAGSDLLATVPERLGLHLARSHGLLIHRLPLAVREFSVWMYWHPRRGEEAPVRFLRGVLAQAIEALAAQPRRPRLRP